MIEKLAKLLLLASLAPACILLALVAASAEKVKS